MANKLDLSDIEWRFLSSLAMTNKHYALYRCDEYKLQWEQITNRNQTTGEFRKGKNYYFIDGCDREFTELQELCDVWNELHNFDDPNNEIVWEKKIVPKINL